MYLAADRPELRFAAQEAARRMAAPTVGDVAGLKRLGRFRIARPRLVNVMRYQGDFVAPRAYAGSPDKRARVDWLYAAVDSNWADCRLTRKSTSGGALFHGDRALCTWSVTQASRR